jgi:hypothetical protein
LQQFISGVITRTAYPREQPSFHRKDAPVDQSSNKNPVDLNFKGRQSARRAVAPVDRSSNGMPVDASSGQERSPTNNKNIICLPNNQQMILLEIYFRNCVCPLGLQYQ